MDALFISRYQTGRSGTDCWVLLGNAGLNLESEAVLVSACGLADLNKDIQHPWLHDVMAAWPRFLATPRSSGIHPSQGVSRHSTVQGTWHSPCGAVFGRTLSRYGACKWPPHNTDRRSILSVLLAFYRALNKSTVSHPFLYVHYTSIFGGKRADKICTGGSAKRSQVQLACRQRWSQQGWGWGSDSCKGMRDPQGAVSSGRVPDSLSSRQTRFGSRALVGERDMMMLKVRLQCSGREAQRGSELPIQEDPRWEALCGTRALTLDCRVGRDNLGQDALQLAYSVTLCDVQGRWRTWSWPLGA
jgi:hypothetical protein